MIVETRYVCEICRSWYDTQSAAEACEARGVPPKVPRGTIVGDSSPWAMYAGVLLVVAENRIRGHGNILEMWATRDNGAGDSLGADRCGEQSSFTYGAAVINLGMPAFGRMMEFLAAEGIPPLVWDGSRAVALEVWLERMKQEGGEV